MDQLVLPARVTGGDFGGWLRDTMAQRGISQRVLAMRTGISNSTISRLAANERTPTLTTAVAIVQVLGRPPARGEHLQDVSSANHAEELPTPSGAKSGEVFVQSRRLTRHGGSGASG
jgi:transcriptional regulator with XRE-family HTH domain